MCFGRRVFGLVLAAALGAVALSSAFGQTYSIKTVAGGGLPVNITGTSASLGHVGGIAPVDSAAGLRLVKSV